MVHRVREKLGLQAHGVARAVDRAGLAGPLREKARGVELHAGKRRGQLQADAGPGAPQLRRRRSAPVQAEIVVIAPACLLNS